MRCAGAFLALIAVSFDDPVADRLMFAIFVCRNRQMWAFLLACCLALAMWHPLLLGAAVAAPVDSLNASPTLRKIRDTGLITVGYRLTSAPFSYLDAQREPIGYSVELCQHVVEAVRQRLAMPDLEVRLMAVTSATRLPLVANGTVDLECGVTTNNEERARNQAFSVTIFVAASKLLSLRSAPVQSLEDLRGKAVATTLATTSIQLLQSENQRQHMNMKILAGLDDIDGFRTVMSGKAAAYAMDDVLLHSLVAASSNPSDYVIAPQALTEEPYAIGLRRGDPVFKHLVDDVIIGLYRSGQIRSIYHRWFLSPIPVLGFNLNLPMSPAFERVIQRPTDTSDPSAYR